jgi:hypothetical protein
MAQSAPTSITDSLPKQPLSFASKCTRMPVEQLISLEKKMSEWLKTNKTHELFPKYLLNYKTIVKYMNLKMNN